MNSSFFFCISSTSIFSKLFSGRGEGGGDSRLVIFSTFSYKMLASPHYMSTFVPRIHQSTEWNHPTVPMFRTITQVRDHAHVSSLGTSRRYETRFCIHNRTKTGKLSHAHVTRTELSRYIRRYYIEMITQTSDNPFDIGVRAIVHFRNFPFGTRGDTREWLALSESVC